MIEETKKNRVFYFHDNKTGRIKWLMKEIVAAVSSTRYFLKAKKLLDESFNLS